MRWWCHTLTGRCAATDFLVRSEKKAISKINDLDADEFLDHVARNHPAPQAPRYIYKLEQALDAINQSRTLSAFPGFARERK